MRLLAERRIRSRNALSSTESEPLREDDQAMAEKPKRFRPLTKRAEFQRVSRGRRRSAPAFTLQAMQRETAEDLTPRNGTGEQSTLPLAGLGFTVTKKVGNAVVRNRIRRRLKAAVAQAAALEARPCHDYVVMARREALARGFAALIDDIEGAFCAIARGDRDGRGAGKARTHRFRDEASPIAGSGSGRDRSEHEDGRP